MKAPWSSAVYHTGTLVRELSLQKDDDKDNRDGKDHNDGKDDHRDPDKDHDDHHQDNHYQR